MMTKNKKILVGAGVAALAALALVLANRKAAASTAPAAPALPAPSAPHNIVVTLPINVPHYQSIDARLGDSVSLTLPPGATWSANNAPPSPTSGNAPIVWTYQGPGQVTLNWNAPDGSPQVSNLTFTTLI